MLLSSKYTQQDTALSVTTWPPWLTCSARLAATPLAPAAAACVATGGATGGATVYTNAPKLCREAILANLCTLLRPHVCPQRRNSVHKCPKTGPRGYFRRSVYTPVSPTHVCPRDRAGSRVPRRQRPHGTRDARALGPEDHAAEAVTQPATHTSSRSLAFSSLLLSIAAKLRPSKLRRTAPHRQSSAPPGAQRRRPRGPESSWDQRWRRAGPS